jgi:ketosteroid isomerase-like protein
MELWSDDDEICCVHPGGERLVGAAAIRASFAAIFGNGAIDAVPHRVRRLESHSSAVHSVVEKIRVATAEGERFAWAVATNVYLKSARGWRLVAHHASPGSPDESPDSVEAVSTLH